ncbi:MAG: hypothetical protein FD166_3137 [Bacteroidetes bacterium]|nr:MAG: hypothetical protein FD166_3137 [Bacteroidota bacterium]
MPIEIKELHIRVNVTPPASGQTPPAPGGSPGQPERLTGRQRQELIAECVEQVMKILENKKER